MPHTLCAAFKLPAHAAKPHRACAAYGLRYAVTARNAKGRVEDGPSNPPSTRPRFPVPAHACLIDRPTKTLPAPPPVSASSPIALLDGRCKLSVPQIQSPLLASFLSRRHVSSANGMPERRNDGILDFRFWILDWNTGRHPPPPIANPKSKIQNSPLTLLPPRSRLAARLESGVAACRLRTAPEAPRGCRRRRSGPRPSPPPGRPARGCLADA